MSTKTKKTLTRVASIATSGATILWLSGVSMLMPAMAATYANGTLLKGSTGDVWVVNNNLKSPVRSIEVFTNSGYDWTKVTTVSDSALNAVSTATLIKTADNPDVYRLELNFTRKLASIEIFNSYSLDWNKISTVSQPVMDSFSYAPIYQYGADLFWRDSSNILHQFPTMDLFTGNGYNVRDLIIVNANEYGSFALGEAISSAPSTPVTPVTGDLSVALSADTPVSAVLASDSSLPSSYYGFGAANFANFTFTNGSGADIKVTNLSVKRLGISGDSTITDLYLFDGYTRLTDEATFSSGVATFNDASGIFTVPANSSKTISVRGDYYSTATITGQTVGVSINAATSVVSNAASVSGSFPMSGNLMSITESSDLGTAALSSVTSPSATVEAQADFTAWTNTLTVATQDLNLEMIRFTQVGSISVGDFTNIRLRINNVDVATGALVTGKTGQDLIFDLHSNPYKILKGTAKNITVVGDIVGGTSRTLRLGIDKSADIMLKDLGYGNYTMVTGTFPSRVIATEISTGTITMTKRTDSPASSLTIGATSQSLAKFDVKANGEEIKINTLKVQAYMSATTSTTTLIRNVSLYLNGVQVGNTTNVAVTGGASQTAVGSYTSFNIYQKIPAATTVTLEVKGDVYTCSATACATNVAAAADKIQIKIIGGASEDNAQGMISLDATIDAPGSTATANEMTVGTGTLSLYKNTAYSDQTLSSGGLIKMGSYNLQANAYDTVNINAFTVAYVNQVGTIATSKWSNMYLVYGGTTSAVKGTMTASNVFSVNAPLAANASMQIDVYGTLDASVTSGAASTTMVVTATKATDGADASALVQDGQNITVGSASRSVAIDTVIPAAIVVGGTQNVEMMNIRFKSLSAPSTIDQMRIQYTAGTLDTDYDALISCKLNYPTDGGTAETAYLPFVYSSANTYYATFTGMTMYLPSNLDKTVKVYCNLNYAGTGYADTGDDPRITLYDYRATSGGTQTIELQANWGNTTVTSQRMVLRASKPVIATNALSSTFLTAGTGITIAKFTITPDAAGAIGWSKLVFAYSSSTVPQLTTGNTYLKVYNENTGQQVTASSTDIALDYDAKTITFYPDAEQIVGSATTYTLKATIGGTLVTGDYLSVYLENAMSVATTPENGTSYAEGKAQTTATSFVWSDRSDTSHSINTSDWTHDWLVKQIGSGYGWTMTR